MIDLHSHILPGVDDGAQTLDDSLEIARSCVAEGVELLAATPHVRDDFPTSPETMERLVDELRGALQAAGIALDLRRGGEIAFDWLDRLAPAELKRFGLAGNPSYLLVESPYYGWPLRAVDHSFQLRLQGVTMVLAHPERNLDVQANPELLRPLVEAGVLVQVTAASIDGRLGRPPEETGRGLIERGLVHMIASDAHTPEVREAGLAAAAEAVGDEALARWLSAEMPAAIVAGTPLPARPERRRRGFFRR